MAFIHIITHFTCLTMRTSIINNTHILFISALHLSLYTAALVTFNDEEEGLALYSQDFSRVNGRSLITSFESSPLFHT